MQEDLSGRIVEAVAADGTVSLLLFGALVIVAALCTLLYRANGRLTEKLIAEKDARLAERERDIEAMSKTATAIERIDSTLRVQTGVQAAMADMAAQLGRPDKRNG